MDVTVTLPVAFVLMAMETALSPRGRPASGCTARCFFHAIRTPHDLDLVFPLAGWSWRIYPRFLAVLRKLLTCCIEAFVSWRSRMSSSASEMNLVAVLQDVTFAVTIRSLGRVLRGFLGAVGPASGGPGGVTPLAQALRGRLRLPLFRLGMLGRLLGFPRRDVSGRAG